MEHKTNKQWKNILRFLNDDEHAVTDAPLEEINAELRQEGMDPEAFVQRFYQERRRLDEDEPELSAEHPSVVDQVRDSISVFLNRFRIPAVALAGLVAALVVWRFLPAEQPGYPVYRTIDNGIVEKRLADLNRRLDAALGSRDYENAVVAARDILRLMEREAGPRHPDTARAMNNLALMYKKTGRMEAARQLYQQAIVIQESVLGKDHPETQTTRSNLLILDK